MTTRRHRVVRETQPRPKHIRTKVSQPYWLIGVDYVWRKYGITKGPYQSEADALNHNPSENMESILKVFRGRIRVEFKRRNGKWEPVTENKLANIWPYNY